MEEYLSYEEEMIQQAEMSGGKGYLHLSLKITSIEFWDFRDIRMKDREYSTSIPKSDFEE